MCALVSFDAFMSSLEQDYEQMMVQRLWQRICSGDCGEKQVQLLWSTLDDDQQRRILRRQLHLLREADADRFVQATGLLKLATPHSACCSSIRRELRRLQDSTTYQEIVRATVEILFAIDVARSGACTVARPVLEQESAANRYAPSQQLTA